MSIVKKFCQGTEQLTAKALQSSRRMDDIVGATTTNKGECAFFESVFNTSSIRPKAETMSALHALINHKLSEISSATLEYIGPSALRNCPIKRPECPNVTYIDEDAFTASAIEEAVFPRVRVLAKNAFKSARSLRRIDMPVLESIGDYAFSIVNDLNETTFPSVTSLGTGVFNSCMRLKKISFPKLTIVKTGALGWAYLSHTFDLPNVVTVEDGGFERSEFPYIVLPSAITIGANAFLRNVALKWVDFPVATSIGATAFSLCASMTACILRSETMCVAGSSDLFTQAFHMIGAYHKTYNPNTLHDGRVYVPAALIEQYRADPVWSAMGVIFETIEDHPEITGGAENGVANSDV